MPTLKRACQHPGCPDVAVTGSVRCARHQHRRHETPGARPSAARRGYDRAWRRVRAAFLKRHPVCSGTAAGTDGRPSVSCGRPATEVDHVVPIADGGERLSWSNLQPLCKGCHSRKTAAENRGAGGRIAPRDHGRQRPEAGGPSTDGRRGGAPRIPGGHEPGDRGGGEIFTPSGFGSEVAGPETDPEA